MSLSEIWKQPWARWVGKVVTFLCDVLQGMSDALSVFALKLGRLAELYLGDGEYSLIFSVSQLIESGRQ